MIRTTNILGVNITNARKVEILEYLLDRLQNSKRKLFIVTPNPEMIMYAYNHLAYKDKLNDSSIALPDGVGLFIAAWILGKQLQERISGVDFIEELCRASREKPLSMGFLGAKAGVAERAADCLQQKYPWLDVAFASDQWKDSGWRTGKKSLDILFVAYGVPKQEEWITAHLSKIPVAAAMGVGGAFDFLSGNVRRAPYLIRTVGLEWLFRLILQPWRWKRQLALIEFLFFVLQQRFFSSPQQ